MIISIKLIVINFICHIEFHYVHLSLILVITQFQESFKKLSAGIAISVQNPGFTGGIRYQQPLEIGTPVSIFANVATLSALTTNITKTSNPGGVTKTEGDILSQ